MSRTASILCLLAGLSALGGCGGDPETADHRRALDAWHAERLERLRADDGWLTLIGLFPLAEGSWTLGAADGSDLRLEADAPGLIGTLAVEAGEVRFAAADGVEATLDGRPLTGSVPLASDRDGAPDVVRVGTVGFHVIERGGSLLLRVKDSASAVRRSFGGIDRFPADASWRVTARLQTQGMPRTVPIADVLGNLEHQPCPGLLVFEREGFTHRLIPIGEPGGSLFIIFRDRTTGESTYGGGRYLDADPPGPDGTVVLDFNRAVNPPCAFTPYATCPLPPDENFVQDAVAAGEKAWAQGH